MSAWNGNMDYSFSEKSFARSEVDGTLSNQIFIREGGLKHKTNITSSNLLTSLSLDYNLTKKIKVYAEAGTNGNEFAYGTGLQYNTSGLTIYIPMYTENGLFNGEDFLDGIRLGVSTKIDLSVLGL